MYKQSKVSDINIHHFGFRFSGLVPIRDVAPASPARAVRGLQF